jgi:hypothetical protein
VISEVSFLFFIIYQLLSQIAVLSSQIAVLLSQIALDKIDLILISELIL